jgi:hypothetical protein
LDFSRNRPHTAQPICSKCLALGHHFRDCTSQVRCRSCWNYGHISRNCLKKKKLPLYYRCIDNFNTESPDRSPNGNRSPYPSSASPNSSPLLLEDIDRRPLAAEDMANYPCDPLPHLPTGAVPVPFNALRPQ